MIRLDWGFLRGRHPVVRLLAQAHRHPAVRRRLEAMIRLDWGFLRGRHPVVRLLAQAHWHPAVRRLLEVMIRLDWELLRGRHPVVRSLVRAHPRGMFLPEGQHQQDAETHRLPVLRRVGMMIRSG
jgi:hypothetical protein